MKRILQTLIITVMTTAVLAQSESDGARTIDVSIKAGQNLDFLNLIRKPDTEALQQEYFSQVFPMASKHGFQMNATFVPVTEPFSGNFQPDAFILMSWPSLKNHHDFILEANQSGYDYRSARKNIWSVFHLSVYEKLEEDIAFTIEEGKVYVITNYWIEDFDSFIKAKERGKGYMEKHNGKLVAVLRGATSDPNYEYKPDVCSITVWDSLETVEAFFKEARSQSLDDGTTKVQQWATVAVFR